MRVFQKDLVSIVTPVYNGENYIKKLLDSVLEQTWKCIEMIISDDGSDDETLKLVEAYRTSFEKRGFKLKVITGAHDCAAAAVSRGLKLVTGEFLIWPDGDDELLPDSIEKRVNYLKQHNEFQCVRSISKYVDFYSGEEIQREEQLGSLESRKLFWDILWGRTFVCCGCYMLRSSTFFEIYPLGDIPIYPVGQNFQMLLPFMYKYECPTMNEILYIVNRRSDSHSARKLTEMQEREKYKLYEKMIDELVGIIGMTSKQEQKEIQYWKLSRRMDIAHKYNDKVMIVRTHLKRIILNRIVDCQVKLTHFFV